MQRSTYNVPDEHPLSSRIVEISAPRTDLNIRERERQPLLPSVFFFYSPTPAFFGSLLAKRQSSIEPAGNLHGLNAKSLVPFPISSLSNDFFSFLAPLIFAGTPRTVYSITFPVCTRRFASNQRGKFESFEAPHTGELLHKMWGNIPI